MFDPSKELTIIISALKATILFGLFYFVEVQFWFGLFDA